MFSEGAAPAAIPPKPAYKPATGYSDMSSYTEKKKKPAQQSSYMSYGAKPSKGKGPKRYQVASFSAEEETGLMSQASTEVDLV